jgi:hypothetical protein
VVIRANVDTAIVGYIDHDIVESNKRSTVILIDEMSIAKKIVDPWKILFFSLVESCTLFFSISTAWLNGIV